MVTVNSSSPDIETVEISLPRTWQPVKRRMLPGCQLFREGDIAMHHARKLIPLEVNDGDDAKDSRHVRKEAIPCSVTECNQKFTSLLSYENHYKSSHRHSCQTCYRSFPSEFLLDIHIQENHDSLFAVMASRQDMYRCLVASCNDKFRGADDRRQHMVTVHSYPSNFRFHSLKPSAQNSSRKKKAAQSETGKEDMDQPTSQLQPNASAGEASNESSTCNTPAPTPDHPACTAMTKTGTDHWESGANNWQGLGEEMEVGEGEKASPRRVFVHKVPRHFSFGRGVSRGFQRPPAKEKGGHWHQQLANHDSGDTTTNIENVDMKDMADALNETV